MTETTYEIGDVAHLTVSFTVSGVATDPTAVTGSVRKPDSTVTAYTVTTNQIVKDSTGNYHLDITTDQAGWWTYKLVGTGVATDTGQGTFYVNPDRTATQQKNYVLVDELKQALALSDQTYADIDIQRACSAASRAIDNRLNRFFYTATDTRYYTPDWRDDALDVIDLQTISSFTLDTAGDNTFSTTWTQNTDYYLEPFNAAETGRPYDVVRIRHQSGRTWPTYQRSVKITGTYGWATVPDPVNQYALILASKLLDRARKSPNGVIVFGLDAPIATRISRNDPDFELLLGDYTKAKPAL